MDYSQYLRLKQEAANVYINRTKTVDASFLSLQKKQKAAYSGYNNIQAIPYFNGAPVLDNTSLNVAESCPKQHQFIQGFTATNRLSQQEDVAFRKAGAAVCGDTNYSTASPGIQLLNCTTVSTILKSFNNNTSKPGQWKPYGYGVAQYFPNLDLTAKCSTCGTRDTPISFPSG